MLNLLRFRITDSKLPPLTKQEAKVAIKLALGLTKKEIASNDHKSIHTINQQARMVAFKTGSRNLADIVRWVLLKINKQTEDSLIQAMNDALIVFFLVTGSLFLYSIDITSNLHVTSYLPLIITSVSIYSNYNNNHRQYVGERTRLFTENGTGSTLSQVPASELSIENK